MEKVLKSHMTDIKCSERFNGLCPHRVFFVSTGVFFQLFPMWKECMQLHLATWRKSLMSRTIFRALWLFCAAALSASCWTTRALVMSLPLL